MPLSAILSLLVEDPFIDGTSEQNLHPAIERLLDIGNHFVTDRGPAQAESDVAKILCLTNEHYS